MVDLSHQQQEALKDEKRHAIWQYLQRQELPVTLGTILQEIEGIALDRHKAYYHVTELVRVGLVEKVGEIPATYRAVADA